MRFGLVSFRGPNGKEENFDAYPSKDQTITPGNTYLFGRGLKKSVKERADVFTPMPEEYKLKGSKRGKVVQFVKDTYPLYASKESVDSYVRPIKPTTDNVIVTQEDGSSVVSPGSMAVDRPSSASSAKPISPDSLDIKKDYDIKEDYDIKKDFDIEDYDMLQDVFYDAPDVHDINDNKQVALIGQPQKLSPQAYDDSMKVKTKRSMSEEMRDIEKIKERLSKNLVKDQDTPMFDSKDLLNQLSSLKKTEQTKPASKDLVTKQGLENAIKSLKKSSTLPMELKKHIRKEESDLKTALDVRRKAMVGEEETQEKRKKLKEVIADLPSISTRTRQGAASAEALNEIKKSLTLTDGNLSDQRKQLKAVDKIQTQLTKGKKNTTAVKNVIDVVKTSILKNIVIEKQEADSPNSEWGDSPRPSSSKKPEIVTAPLINTKKRKRGAAVQESIKKRTILEKPKVATGRKSKRLQEKVSTEFTATPVEFTAPTVKSKQATTRPKSQRFINQKEKKAAAEELLRKKQQVLERDERVVKRKKGK